MSEFEEHPDRHEAIWRIEPHRVTISIDKPISPEKLKETITTLRISASELIRSSIAFFESKKSESHIDYIDDLSDPQILASPDSFSVYWWSDKGEANAECVIGVEFTAEGVPIQLTIGD